MTDAEVIVLEEANRRLKFEVLEQKAAIEMMSDIIDDNAKQIECHDFKVSALIFERDKALNDKRHISIAGGIITIALIAVFIWGWLR